MSTQPTTRPTFSYPVLTVHDSVGGTIAANQPMPIGYGPGIEVLDDCEACRVMAELIGGYVMQKDDAYLPAFSLYSFG